MTLMANVVKTSGLRKAGATLPRWDDPGEDSNWFGLFVRADEYSSPDAGDTIATLLGLTSGIIDVASIANRSFLGAGAGDQATSDPIDFGIVTDQSGNSLRMWIAHNSLGDSTFATGVTTLFCVHDTGNNFPVIPDGAKNITIDPHAAGWFNLSGVAA